MLITVYNNIGFGCIKETSLSDISFMQPKLMFDRQKTDNNYFVGYIKKDYAYLPIIPTTDNSK